VIELWIFKFLDILVFVKTGYILINGLCQTNCGDGLVIGN